MTDLQLQQQFIAESDRMICAARNSLIEFQRSDSHIPYENLNDIYRIVHAITGIAGFLQRSEIYGLARYIEKIIHNLHTGHIRLNDLSINMLRYSLKTLQSMIADYESSTMFESACIINQIESILYVNRSVLAENIRHIELIDMDGISVGYCIEDDVMMAADDIHAHLYVLKCHLTSLEKTCELTPLDFIYKLFHKGQIIDSRIVSCAETLSTPLAQHAPCCEIVFATDMTQRETADSLHIPIQNIIPVRRALSADFPEKFQLQTTGSRHGK